MTFKESDWPYVEYTSHPWPEVCAWCEEAIGVFDQDWYKLGEDVMAQALYSDYKSTYLFKQEKYAILFKLRWS